MPNRYRHSTQTHARLHPHHQQYPLLTALYRGVAVAAWAVAAVLYVFGLHAGPVDITGVKVTPLDYYAAACLTTLVAMTFTARVTAETLVTTAFAREAERSREFLADAVAEALADELVERGLVVSPDGHDTNGDNVVSMR